MFMPLACDVGAQPAPKTIIVSRNIQGQILQCPETYFDPIEWQKFLILKDLLLDFQFMTQYP